jgi:hypothetical protein
MATKGKRRDPVLRDRERLEARIKQRELQAALELCDRYFTALAETWAKHGGKLVDADGNPYVTDQRELGLAELCNQAGEACRRALHPEEFKE